jgi:hypothetical protein
MSKHIGLGRRTWVARVFIVCVVALGTLRAAVPVGHQIPLTTKKSATVVNPPLAYVSAHARADSAVEEAQGLAGPRMSIDIPTHLSVRAQPLWLAG